jgi:OOP family OmpA-OmpF porin
MTDNIRTIFHAFGAMTLASVFCVQGQESAGYGYSYVRAGIGPALTPKTDVEEFFGPMSGTEVEFDVGLRFEVTVGFQFTDWLGAEFETGFTFNEADSVTGSPDADFELTNAPLLGNVIVQCPATPPLVPFIGAGIGFASATIDIDSFTLPGRGTFTGSDSDIVLAYQGIAGVRYEFNEQMGVSLTYKYFGTGKPDWEADFGTGGIGFGRTETHSFLASFTFKF